MRRESAKQDAKNFNEMMKSSHFSLLRVFLRVFASSRRISQVARDRGRLSGD
jgi:hypothetical protein